jgi:hypothetical protein
LGIIGPHPSSGFRIDLIRQADEPPWLYRGTLATAVAELPLIVTVEAAGDVLLEAELEGALAERVRLLVRQVVKHALAEEQAPPRRIQRWRP